jgi:hypothetical protein
MAVCQGHSGKIFKKFLPSLYPFSQTSGQVKIENRKLKRSAGRSAA